MYCKTIPQRISVKKIRYELCGRHMRENYIKLLVGVKKLLAEWLSPNLYNFVSYIVTEYICFGTKHCRLFAIILAIMSFNLVL